MSQERIDESHRFTKSKKIKNDSQVAKMDSSLTAFAQNDEFMDSHETIYPYRHTERSEVSKSHCERVL